MQVSAARLERVAGAGWRPLAPTVTIYREPKLQNVCQYFFFLPLALAREDAAVG